MPVSRSFSALAALKKFKQRRTARDELLKLTPLVSQLLTAIDITQRADPAFLTELAFKLYRRERIDVTMIKTPPNTTRSPRRFARFFDDLKTGESVLSASDGRHILSAADHFLDATQPVDGSGLDVGSHFRMSSSFGKKGRILYTAVKCFRPERMLEIGTAYGMSAQFLMLAATRYTAAARLDTVETAEPQFSMARAMLDQSFPGQVRCHQGMSSNILDAIAVGETPARYDLVFHDGAHDEQTYREDFGRLKPLLKPGALVIFDDINWFDKRFVASDPGCYRGWTSVVEDERVLAAAEVDKSIGIALIG